MITMSKVLAKWSYFAHNGNIYQIWYPHFVAIYQDSLAINYMGLEWTINHLISLLKLLGDMKLNCHEVRSLSNPSSNLNPLDDHFLPPTKLNNLRYLFGPLLQSYVEHYFGVLCTTSFLCMGKFWAIKMITFLLRDYDHNMLNFWTFNLKNVDIVLLCIHTFM